MTRSIALGLLGLWLACAACQSQTEITSVDTQKSLLTEIAEDPLFLTMLQAKIELYEHFHSNLEVADAFLAREKYMDDLCQLALDPQVESATTIAFQQDLCAMMTSAANLRAAYPQYTSLSAADKSTIRALCADHTGYDFLQQSMQIAYSPN